MVRAGRSIAGTLSIFAEISNLREENHRLAEDSIRAKVDSATLDECQQENINLKEALEYKNAHPEMKLLLAEIIGLDPTNFYDSLILNKGSEDGVSEGMAVIYLGVLVGKTDQVTPDTSQVILITSKDSIVQVMLESSRTTGILRGGISGMTLENIPLDTPIAESENIITSGLGGKLPKGIFVGNAGGEVSAKSDIFKTIEVKSPINFSKLENLFIIIGI
jgi:rod shape-determining protein MreC